MNSGEDKLLIARTLKSMLEYTQKHFSSEEKLLRQYNFPGLEEHCREHDALKRKVESLVERYRTGKNITVLEIVKQVKTWLHDHILGTDQQYSQFLKDKGLD